MLVTCQEVVHLTSKALRFLILILRIQETTVKQVENTTIVYPLKVSGIDVVVAMVLDLWVTVSVTVVQKLVLQQEAVLAI